LIYGASPAGLAWLGLRVRHCSHVERGWIAGSSVARHWRRALSLSCRRS